MYAEIAYNYHNIGLLTHQISTLDTRNEADTSVEFAGCKLTIPLIASPMPDVCDGKMARRLSELGSYGFIHRFNTVQEQVAEYQISGGNCGCAIGINNDYFERFCTLADEGCKCFCIDIANGATRRIEKVIEKILEKHTIYLVVGNVATQDCYAWLADFPVYAIRAGIAGGSVCTTRTEAGIFYPMASSICACASVKKNTLLIADGSIKEPQDMCKALALGADIAMAGSIFARTEESPAQVIKMDGKLFKIYRGAASFSTQQIKTEKPEYVEGAETLLDYRGPVEKLIKRFRNGLRSSMSYANARTIKEYKENIDWCYIA